MLELVTRGGILGADDQNSFISSSIVSTLLLTESPRSLVGLVGLTAELAFTVVALGAECASLRNEREPLRIGGMESLREDREGRAGTGGTSGKGAVGGGAGAGPAMEVVRRI
jgi:hypothetical protein